MSAPTNFTVGTTANALAAAPSNTRYGYIQNVGTNPLFVSFDGSASTSHYNLILAPCTGAADGTGGIASWDNYIGVVTVAGTSPSYIAWWI